MLALAVGTGGLARDGWSANSQIEAIVQEAMAGNPAVIAAREHYDAQGKMPIQAATLPEPEISLQQLTVGGAGRLRATRPAISFTPDSAPLRKWSVAG